MLAAGTCKITKEPGSLLTTLKEVHDTTAPWTCRAWPHQNRCGPADLCCHAALKACQEHKSHFFGLRSYFRAQMAPHCVAILLAIAAVARCQASDAQTCRELG